VKSAVLVRDAPSGRRGGVDCAVGDIFWEGGSVPRCCGASSLVVDSFSTRSNILTPSFYAPILLAGHILEVQFASHSPG